MFIVIVEQWADGSPWRTDMEVFADYQSAEECADRFQGLWDSPWGWVGEESWIQSVSLDGAAACQETGWIWHYL